MALLVVMLVVTRMVVIPNILPLLSKAIFKPPFFVIAGVGDGTADGVCSDNGGVGGDGCDSLGLSQLI